MDNSETFNSETIEESVQSEIPVSESAEEVYTEATEEVLESETESVETGIESAQTNETLIDYTETLNMIHTEVQSINYLLSLVVFLEMFMWIENKINHIVRRVSNKWKR